jgi:hypothetical protein
VPGDEARPERPLPGDALLQLCHCRHAHLSLSLKVCCAFLTCALCALHLGLDDSSRCVSCVGVRAESYENQQSET